MRAPNLIFASAVLAGLLAALPFGLRSAHADGITSRSDILPVSAIKKGMKGYGLTVFEGTKPERFDVEVIDVLDNFRPRQELILIKTRHPRLEVAKVVAGMSGSPIYINGKMIGAYAYGWQFGSEPVAGVTPIRAMLDDIVRPLPPLLDGWPLFPLPHKQAKAARVAPSGTNRFRGKLGSYDLEQHSKQVGKAKLALGLGKSSALAPVATPLLMGGMNASSIEVAKHLLEPLGLEPMQAGGGGANDPNAPKRYVDGGAIGVQMIRGDVSSMGLGTVTRVEGDKLVAFGHPMMQSGITAMPTAIAKVLWFLASDQRSFKIGTPVRDVGALVNDRQASIVVAHSAQAPVIPMTLKVKGVAGAAFTDWKFDVAHEKFMTPSFMAIALGNALTTTASEKQDVSWTAKSRLKIKGFGEIVLEDFGVSIGGSPEAQDFIRSNLVRAVGALLNNSWEPVILERADTEIELRFAREIVRLRGAELIESEIDAGQPARIRLTLAPWAGPDIHKVISVPLPEHLAGQTVTLEISPGYMEERDVADPDTLAELVRNLENPVYPPKSVVVSYSAPAGAVSYRGHVAKNLPPGAMDSIRPTTSSVAPEAFQPMVRHVVPLSDFMVGQDRVSVSVRPVLR
ncbi:MAG TPA: SpoIVB peptidase S55 domain-containing protein [Polyangiaceae bacterium]|nr:SpoIVB peptidase S55 domain-containing protein [Polyangiaceae bacterium]